MTNRQCRRTEPIADSNLRRLSAAATPPLLVTRLCAERVIPFLLFHINTILRPPLVCPDGAVRWQIVVLGVISKNNGRLLSSKTSWGRVKTLRVIPRRAFGSARSAL